MLFTLIIGIGACPCALSLWPSSPCMNRTPGLLPFRSCLIFTGFFSFVCSACTREYLCRTGMHVKVARSVCWGSVLLWDFPGIRDSHSDSREAEPWDVVSGRVEINLFSSSLVFTVILMAQWFQVPWIGLSCISIYTCPCCSLCVNQSAMTAMLSTLVFSNMIWRKMVCYRGWRLLFSG